MQKPLRIALPLLVNAPAPLRQSSRVHSWIGAERSGWAMALPSPTLYRFTFAGSIIWWKVAPIGECTLHLSSPSLDVKCIRTRLS